MKPNRQLFFAFYFGVSLAALSMLLSGGNMALADEVAAEVPLPEHPRPDFQRSNWLNLNGTWDFDFDRENQGLKERWYLDHAWTKKIVVPFAHQSPLSGVNDTQHYRHVWYHRQFTVPSTMEGKCVLLHIDAADFEATVWMNGKECGKYESAQTPITIDITPFLKSGNEAKNDLVIRVYDNEIDPEQPRGKQKATGKRNFFNYTHITGLWQTVWLEAVDARHLDRYQAVTSIDPAKAELTVFVKNAPENATVYAILNRQLPPDAPPRKQEALATATGQVTNGQAKLTLDAAGAKPWSPDEPTLYDLRLQLRVEGKVVDTVDSYLGFRTVEARDQQFFLNGKPIWLNGALDQGYWPQGILTPPSDQARIDDIQWVKRLGLNHIRKHQVVGDPRFLYYCDRLGLLVWGEMANADERGLTKRGTRIAQRQWKRAIRRDFNHPSIVTWVYSNEHWMHGGPLKKRIDHYRKAYHKMKKWDPTRPVVDTSGYFHVESDILDVHYNEPMRRLAGAYEWASGELEKPSKNEVFLVDMPYQKQPIVVSEWLAEGFTTFKPEQEREWLEAYLPRLASFATHPLCAGHCYIQLYDVESERNGYLHYDRRPKLSSKTIETLRKAHLQAAKRDLKFDWKAFIEEHTR